jgi:hypothetical protein
VLVSDLNASSVANREAAAIRSASRSGGVPPPSVANREAAAIRSDVGGTPTLQTSAGRRRSRPV